TRRRKGYSPNEGSIAWLHCLSKPGGMPRSIVAKIHAWRGSSMQRPSAATWENCQTLPDPVLFQASSKDFPPPLPSKQEESDVPEVPPDRIGYQIGLGIFPA